MVQNHCQIKYAEGLHNLSEWLSKLSEGFFSFLEFSIVFYVYPSVFYWALLCPLLCSPLIVSGGAIRFSIGFLFDSYQASLCFSIAPSPVVHIGFPFGFLPDTPLLSVGLPFCVSIPPLIFY